MKRNRDAAPRRLYTIDNFGCQVSYSMHRARNAGIIGPDQHLGLFTDLCFGHPTRSHHGHKRPQIVMDVGVVLASWDHSIRRDDNPFIVCLERMVQDPARRLNRANPCACFHLIISHKFGEVRGLPDFQGGVEIKDGYVYFADKESLLDICKINED